MPLDFGLIDAVRKERLAWQADKKMADPAIVRKT